MITDEQRLQAIIDGVKGNHEIRSYEVSLWTLQDAFISVLKWSNVEHRGRIQDPQMELNVDGTQNFSFSIPMYLYYEVPDKYSEHITRLEKKENPIWYNTQNGNLIVGLRKIKVIFNKQTADQKVFEFVITKVNEKHENDQSICEVTCEGLAFHELGKIGYKYTLNIDTFLVNKTDWDEHGSWTKYDGTTSTEEPVQNVQYWCEQCGLIPTPSDESTMDAKKWYYSIEMNWDDRGYKKSSGIIYEKEYVSSWKEDLSPKQVEQARQKLRSIDVNESNVYNITQEIAETFQIYCRYEYEHDAYYHITKRKVIFYNNYLNDKSIISFTYPYATRQISRELDSTELTTKMYVIPQDSEAVVSGKITIADCSANKLKEDYILNFDYLHEIGTISDEQYKEITVFTQRMYETNTGLEDLSRELSALEQTMIDQEALMTVYNESIVLDQERLDYNDELYHQLGASNGYLTRGPGNPYTSYIKTDDKGRTYISLECDDKGIDIDTNHFMIFRVYNSAQKKFKNRITNYTIENDIYGFPSKIILNNFNDNFTLDYEYSTVDTSNNTWTISVESTGNSTVETSSSLLVYLIYKYNPHLYYESINQMWLKKINADKENYALANSQYEIAKSQRDAKLAEQTSVLAEKRIMLKDFEELMGPALREGYWQPEDYQDYGDSYSATLNVSSAGMMTIYATGKGARLGFDTQLFDDESKLYYEESVLRDRVYYPCIGLTDEMLTTIDTWIANNKIPTLIFNNNYYRTLTNEEAAQIQNLSMFSLGGEMEFGYISDLSERIPVLILTGAQDMTDDEIHFLINSGHARLGTTEITVVNNNATLNIGNDAISLNGSNFYWYPNKTTATGVKDIEEYYKLYPRIKISSNELNTSSVVLKMSNLLLEENKDYYILTRSKTYDTKAYLEYYITIKPEFLLSHWSQNQVLNLKYSISNAATCIYLDALDVMEESAKPKVSYTVDVNVLNPDYLSTLYNKLACIIMINDAELKFNNVYGYISKINLNLDSPWEDKIEVKNYTTKFEDLFSTIVASSEEMRKNSAALGMACGGDVPLSEGALEETIENNYDILQQFLDAGFDSSQVIKDKLTELFTEAASILTSANESLDTVRNLNIKNAEILEGFARKVASDLVPTVHNSRTKPKDFKTGDVWNELDEHGNVIGTYVATANSSNTANGFTRTFDGTLSAIKGAKLNIDTVEGTVEILAQNKIDIKTGGYLCLAADESVDIVGNKQVNIGGATINIASFSKGGTSYSAGGINLLSSSTTSGSRILMTPTKITMGGSSIEMYTGDTGTASAVKISGTDGIWIGSGRKIELYTGTTNTGTSVQITPSRFFAGVASGTAAAAVDISAGSIIMATGTGVSLSTSDIALNASLTSLTGLKLTKDSFGLAVGSGTTRSVILANTNGITIGSGETPTTSGSYVSISGNGVTIGSLADLTLNTNNIKLQTNVKANGIGTTIFAIGSNLQSITNSTNVNSLNNNSTVDFLINSTGVFLKGYVYAAGGSFTGTVSASSFTATCTNGKFKADGTSLGFYNTSDAAVMTLSGTTMTVASGYNLSVGGNLDISANNLLINSNPSSGAAYFRLGPQSTPALQYTASGLTVTGNITATSFTLSQASNYTTTRVWLVNTNSTVYTASTDPGGWTSSPTLIQGQYLHTKITTGLGGQTTTTYEVNYIGKDGADGQDGQNGTSWTVDGLSNGTWNNTNCVSLTSTGGLVIGANSGIYMPLTSNSNLTMFKVLAGNGSTAGTIELDTYANTSATAPSNYIHMNSSGIQIKADQIKINDNDCWSRGDIIYKSTRPDASEVAGLSEYIWIQPNTYAESRYTTNTTYTTTGQNYNVYASVLLTSGNPPASGADSYTFDLSVQVQRETFTTVTPYPEYSFSANVSINGNTIQFPGTAGQEFGNDIYTYTFSWSTSSYFLSNVTMIENLKVYRTLGPNSTAEQTGSTVKWILKNATLTVTYRSTQANGTYPCNVYYISTSNS